MDSFFDAFIVGLPSSVTETVIKNFLSTAGKVLRVKIVDDKRNPQNKLSFVSFSTMDEALEAVRIADKSTAFGNTQLKASISRKSLEQMEAQTASLKVTVESQRYGGKIENTKPLSPNQQQVASRGRGRGLQTRLTPQHQQNHQHGSVKLNDVKLREKELIDVEIVDLPRVDFVFARLLKSTENSKIEITDLLNKTNSSQHLLVPVDNPIVGNSYLAKWDDECYYRAELLEIIGNKESFRVTFVDEGTSNDIVTDIKEIPDDALQQYPKQFTKLTLGCIPDNEDLKQFIIKESESKKPSIYWLGNRDNCGVPIVNLFLNDEEIVEKFIQTKRMNIRQNLSVKFDDLPTHKPSSNVQDVTILKSTLKNSSEFTAIIRNQHQPAIQLTAKSNNPTILPTPGDICVFCRDLSSKVAPQRCVIRRRQYFSFDILLIDSGERLNNVSIDHLYAISRDHIIYPPSAITCELSVDKSSIIDDGTLLQILSDEQLMFSIVQHNRNFRYIVQVEVPSKITNGNVVTYPQVDLRSMIGKSYRVVVTHSISPVNFFIQIDKEENAQLLNDIHERLNINYSGQPFRSLSQLRAGTAVIAPFSSDGVDELFRARVIEYNNKNIQVLFVDYGNDAWVPLDRLLEVHEDLLMRPGLAYNCQLNVDIVTEAYGHAISLFTDLVINDESGSELSMQVVDVVDLNDGIGGQKLVIDLTSQIRGVISTVLDKSGTCRMKKFNESFDTNKNVPMKPLCNGDVKKFVAFSDQSQVISDRQNTIVDDEEKYLLRKISDLEDRVYELEMLLCNSNL